MTPQQPTAIENIMAFSGAHTGGPDLLTCYVAVREGVAEDPRSQRRFVRFHDGRVTVSKDGGDPDLVVRVPLGVWSSFLEGGLALSDVSAIEVHRPDEAPTPLPPTDLASNDALPLLEGVSYRVQHIEFGGPAGTVPCVETFVDGRPTSYQLGFGEAEIRIRMPCFQVMRYRAGDIGLLDALKWGSIDGSVSHMQMAAGLAESEGYRSHVGANPPLYRVLGAWSEHLASPGWQERQAQLRKQGEATLS